MKEFLKRVYHGFSITMIVDLIVHFCLAQAIGSVVTPQFAAHFKCEASAVLAQLVLVGLIGAAFAVAAMLFQIEKWSFLQQGIVHFLITAAVWMPIAYICWRPISSQGMIFSGLGWMLTYAVTWCVQYFVWKKRVTELNRQISACSEGKR